MILKNTSFSRFLIENIKHRNGHLTDKSSPIEMTHFCGLLIFVKCKELQRVKKKNTENFTADAFTQHFPSRAIPGPNTPNLSKAQKQPSITPYRELHRVFTSRVFSPILVCFGYRTSHRPRTCRFLARLSNDVEKINEKAIVGVCGSRWGGIVRKVHRFDLIRRATPSKAK